MDIFLLEIEVPRSFDSTRSLVPIPSWVLLSHCQIKTMILHGGDTECKLIACGHSVFLHKNRRFECSQKCNLAYVNPKKIKRGNEGRERFFFPKQNKLDIGTFRFHMFDGQKEVVFFCFFAFFGKSGGGGREGGWEFEATAAGSSQRRRSGKKIWGRKVSVAADFLCNTGRWPPLDLPNTKK